MNILNESSMNLLRVVREKYVQPDCLDVDTDPDDCKASCSGSCSAFCSDDCDDHCVGILGSF